MTHKYTVEKKRDYFFASTTYTLRDSVVVSAKIVFKDLHVWFTKPADPNYVIDAIAQIVEQMEQKGIDFSLIKEVYVNITYILGKDIENE